MNNVLESSAPAPTAVTSRAQDLLLEFLREHEAPCPLCGYNLKALVRPICPECGQELALSVGVPRLRLGWLFAAVAPGFFSGIAAIFVLVPIVIVKFVAKGGIPLRIAAVDLFGWCSGFFAIHLSARRHRFLAQSRAAQRAWAIGIWLVHIAALGLFILVAAGFL